MIANVRALLALHFFLSQILKYIILRIVQNHPTIVIQTQENYNQNT